MHENQINQRASEKLIDRAFAVSTTEVGKKEADRKNKENVGNILILTNQLLLAYGDRIVTDSGWVQQRITPEIVISKKVKPGQPQVTRKLKLIEDNGNPPNPRISENAPFRFERVTLVEVVDPRNDEPRVVFRITRDATRTLSNRDVIINKSFNKFIFEENNLRVRDYLGKFASDREIADTLSAMKHIKREFIRQHGRRRELKTLKPSETPQPPLPFQ